MIRFDSVTFTYPEMTEPALRGVTLDVPEGSLSLVVGPTGSGKTTLLRAVNGLVPRFSGGHLSGVVSVAGRQTSEHRLKDMANLVGFVGQDPALGFTTETVESELAYTMEQMGVKPQSMRKRVEETLDLLGLAPLRGRPVRRLSGGEAQRVAIGAVLTAHPQVLVLDEPTSALDPVAAEEVLGAIVRIVHDLGITVLMAEHRLERVVQYADQVVLLSPDGTATVGTPAAMLEHSDLAPPVVELSRFAGWSPPPLSVRDARRLAGELRSRLPAVSPEPVEGSEPVLKTKNLSVVYGNVVAVREVEMSLCRGITAVMGRNGSGKSSLLWAIQGPQWRHSGEVEVDGSDPAAESNGERRIRLVPQNASDLLYLESVVEECRQAGRSSGEGDMACRALVERLLPGIALDSHPADLSEGEKLGLALAIQMSTRPRVLALDEPTRGLDYAAKKRLGSVLREVAATGTAVAVATHDVEFVAEHADRVVVLAEGDIVASGPTSEIVLASPAFAPQVAKVLAPAPYLTVSEVVAAVGAQP